jgi:hypothetical protein
LLSALVLAPSTDGQPEKSPPYQVPTPTAWAEETFALPPAFAPDMKWKGTEELRFAPGMFQADAPDFFSYALLFWLPDDAEIDAKAMEQELLTYYRGLAAAVLRAKKQDMDTKAFTLTVTAAKEQPDKRPGGKTMPGYIGELRWTEPFATGKPQALRLEIHTWGDRLDTVYRSRDLARGNDILFAATGISDSPLLQGVEVHGATAVTHSVLMRSRSGTARYLNTEHNL